MGELKSKFIAFKVTVSQFLKLKAVAKAEKKTMTQVLHNRIINIIPKEYIYCKKCNRPLVEKCNLLGKCVIKCQCGGWGIDKEAKPIIEE